MDKDGFEMYTPLLASGGKNESTDFKSDTRIINLRTHLPAESRDSSHVRLDEAVKQSQPKQDGDYYYVFQFQNPFYNQAELGTDSKVSISSAKQLFNKAFKIFITREKAFNALKEAQDASSISLQDLIIEKWEKFEAQADGAEVLQRDMMKHIINTVLEILQRILKLRVDIFFSRDDDELFLKIWATEENLRIHAKNTDYILQLRVNPEDEIAIFNKVPPYAPFEMDIKVPTETPGVTKIRDIEHLYKHYDKNDIEIKSHNFQIEGSSLFMGKDKIRLIYDQICSMFDPDYLLEVGLMIAHFPVHNKERLYVLKKNWVNDWRFWKKMRLNLVRSYFGEKITIYFAWLEYFTNWLKFASLVGILAYIAEKVYGDVTESTLSMSVSEFSILIYTILICISASIVDIFWVRNEKYIALRWGTTVLDNYEGQRPAYKGEYKKDYITGRYKKFPTNPLKYKIFKFVNMSVVMMFIALIVAITFTIISWRVMRTKSGLSLLVCDIVNGIQIQVMKYVYDRVAKWLNNLENYETNTKYNDALTLKLYLFQFVNSYASLCYLAFVKKFVEGCNQGNCMGELSDALQCIFLVKFVTNLLDIFIPFIIQYFKIYLENRRVKNLKSKNVSHIRLEMTPIELQSKYDPYSSNMSEYMEIILDYGYVILFSAAFPLLPVLALIHNYIEIKIDAWRLCNQCQRPIPIAANSVGIWIDIFMFLSILGAFSNTGILVFTTDIFDSSTASRSWITFLLVEHGILIFKYILGLVVNTTPRKVTKSLLWSQRIVNETIYGNGQDLDEQIRLKNLYLKEIPGYVPVALGSLEELRE